MTTRTLTALFDTYSAAADAVTKLEAAGISHDDISIISNDAAHQVALDATEDHPGTATGASLGTVFGGGVGLLAGLGMFAIPGLGPVVAAGWLAATLVGAGVGAAAGGIVGSLTEVGVSHEDAHAYAEGVSRGGTLITVRADESHQSRVAAILDLKETVDLGERKNDWKTSGGDETYAGEGALASAGDLPLSGEIILPTPISRTAVASPSEQRDHPEFERVRIDGEGR